jgi:hypothetical protein
MATLGERAVVGGVCYIAATIAEPGVIAHTGTLQRIVNPPGGIGFHKAVCASVG